MNVLLIALGRMGQRYQTAIQEYFAADLSRLVTVDPKSPTNPTENHYSTIEEVPEEIAFDLAVDARPNHDRLGMLEQFLARKIPNIVIEKPHATSMAESAEMLARLESLSNPPKVLMPFYERYGQHYQPEVLAQLDAGALKSIVITSGAIGLGCNGIHFIDLANYLFNAQPVEVYAKLQLDSVPSPRGPQFMDHSGTLVVQYPQGEFILQMLPDSSAGCNISMMYEHGKIQILEQAEAEWFWYRQSPDTWQDPFYRTHREVKLTPPCGFEKDIIGMIKQGLDALMYDKPFPNIDDGHVALRVIALAMKSHLERRPIAWTDKASVEDITFQFT